MKTVDQLMDEAFNVPRDPRSAQYKAGVRAALEYRLNAIHIPHPYAMGSVSADAYYAGVEEGHRRWRNEQ